MRAQLLFINGNTMSESRSSKESKHKRKSSERRSKKSKKKYKGEWVELPSVPVIKREDWMTVPVLSKPLTKDPGPQKASELCIEAGMLGLIFI